MSSVLGRGAGIQQAEKVDVTDTATADRARTHPVTPGTPIRPQLDDEGRRYLGRLQANGEHMEPLIGDLLALSRIGRESREPEAGAPR